MYLLFIIKISLAKLQQKIKATRKSSYFLLFKRPVAIGRKIPKKTDKYSDDLCHQVKNLNKMNKQKDNGVVQTEINYIYQDKFQRLLSNIFFMIAKSPVFIKNKTWGHGY